MNASNDHLPIRSVLPGLILIVVVDVLALLGLWPVSNQINQALSLVLLVLPWATLLVLRKPAKALGFEQRQSLRAFGWGMIAGGLWRIISLLINLWAVDLGVSTQAGLTALFAAFVWVPLVEEPFFRGYLGRAFSGVLGLWPGIFLQAALFTFQPVHLNQGTLALISVLGFGILAGWIQYRFDNLWSAWGAHAFANFLPLLLTVR